MFDLKVKIVYLKDKFLFVTRVSFFLILVQAKLIHHFYLICPLHRLSYALFASS